MQIRVFRESDEECVVALWNYCGLTRPWNDPRKDIARKLTVQRELFLVGEVGGRLVASVMAGFEGHRGWVNYLAVAPAMRGRGFAARLMQTVEARFVELGCPKVNLLVRSTSAAVLDFYRHLGYVADDAVPLGKRLIPDFGAQARVVTVSAGPAHEFTKPLASEITLVAGQGVAGDAHCGSTVKHRSRVRQDPTQPNLRQVHLLHTELFAELAAQGHVVSPGDLGENIATSGIALLDLPTGTELRLGDSAVVRLTGLRNPCAQIDRFQAGLMSAVLDRRPDGALVRKAGVMSVVVRGGSVRPGDAIATELPPGPHVPLDRV